MKIHDIRIGNTVFSEIYQKPIGVNLALFTDIAKGKDGYSPILLSPDILTDWGFKCDVASNEFLYSEGCEFTIGVDNGCWFVYQIKMSGFKYFQYLHQLQNLYYALTGTELKKK